MTARPEIDVKAIFGVHLWLTQLALDFRTLLVATTIYYISLALKVQLLRPVPHVL